MKCPYCGGTQIIKKGLRTKKYETVQLYYCHHCQKKFTPLVTKGKTYPLKVILDAISFYNRFYPLEEAAKQVSEKYGLTVSPQTIANWLKDFAEYLPFLRMRDFITTKYDRRDVLVEAKMFHGQIYDFKYHRAKTDCILEDTFRHYKFQPLQEFLELVTAECPHSTFKETERRASEYKDIFNLESVKIIPRQNFAVKNTRLVMQAVSNNKLRHEVLEEFMLLNDSVTVATEVPVLIDEDDIRHYQNKLGFEVPIDLKSETRSTKSETNPNDKNSNVQNVSNFDIRDSNFVITGHIDLLQIRNGVIHILDYKPSAKKQKPVDQLTLYALALARLTGLRLFHFKCAWFDEDDYFEFFPLHVVYKKKKKKKKKK
jgi:transposase-like protein